MDDSTTRRLREAEQRISNLERQLAARVERPAVSNFPRDRWLGVTTRIGSDYPTASDANTFGVKLLSAAYTPVAAGPSTVTQRERGTVVIARTWPSRYLAEGTQVVVDRLRGVPDGGEWWIAGADDGTVEWAYLIGGAGVGLSSSSLTSPYSHDVSNSTSWSVELTANQSADGVFAGTVGSIEGERLSLTQAGRYYVTAHANFYLSPSPQYDGGFRPENWSIRLGLRELGNATDLLRGATAGVIGGPHDQYFSASLSGVVEINDAPHLLNLWASGQHYVPPTTLSLYTWSLFAWRIGSELGT